VKPDPQAACLDVSGIVVHAAPRSAARLREALESIAGVAVHAVSAEGKIVVTLESDSEAGAMRLFERVRALPGAEAVSLVYHQIETDPDEEL
jgi:nitrate reductase NapD